MRRPSVLTWSVWLSALIEAALNRNKANTESLSVNDCQNQIRTKLLKKNKKTFPPHACTLYFVVIVAHGSTQRLVQVVFLALPNHFRALSLLLKKQTKLKIVVV